MAVSNGNPRPGQLVVTTTELDWLEEQLWLITPVRDENDTYYIQNLRSGTYLDMLAGNCSLQWLLRLIH
jgi:hypothetical protein